MMQSSQYTTTMTSRFPSLSNRQNRQGSVLHCFKPSDVSVTRCINGSTVALDIDCDLVSASIAAEQQMKKFGAPPWSIALDKTRKEVTHLTKCMPMARTGLVTPHIHPSTSQEGGDDSNFFPTTVQECSIRLREAKRAVKDIVDNSASQRENEVASVSRTYPRHSLRTPKRTANVFAASRNLRTSNICF
jgi:hypothetical protein